MLQSCRSNDCVVHCAVFVVCNCGIAFLTGSGMTLWPALAGLSLLDTPSYVILLVFVCFLVLSGIFEHVRLQSSAALQSAC